MFAIVVEDSPGVRNALLTFLSRQGVEAVGCETCHQAIAAIQEKHPDLLVSDWDIGTGASGVAVVRYLRRQCQNSKVVMITGRPIDRLIEQTTELKVDVYLKKPFSLQQLKNAVIPISG